MDKELAKYIIKYFPNLLTDDERLALNHHMYTYKLDNSISDNTAMKKVLTEKGLVTSDEKILDFLKNGYDNFEINVAERILGQHTDKVFINSCPNCKKLARTPYARQCRYCGNSWHEIIIGQFKFNGVFKPKDNQFLLLGEISKGEIKVDNFIDLTMLGLNRKLKIESIIDASKVKKTKIKGEIGLGTTELEVNDAIYLMKVGSFGTPVDILRER